MKEFQSEKLKCINNDNFENLTVGKVYETLDFEPNDVCSETAIVIRTDNDKLFMFQTRDRFSCIG